MFDRWIKLDNSIRQWPEVLACPPLAWVAWATSVQLVVDNGDAGEGTIPARLLTPRVVGAASQLDRTGADLDAIMAALFETGLLVKEGDLVRVPEDYWHEVFGNQLIERKKKAAKEQDRRERKKERAPHVDPTCPPRGCNVDPTFGERAPHVRTVEESRGEEEEINGKPEAAAVAAEPESSTEEFQLESPAPPPKAMKPIKAKVEQPFLEGLDRTEITALASAAFVACGLEPVRWITPPQVKQMQILAGLPDGDTFAADLRTVLAYLPQDRYWDSKRRNREARTPTLTMLFAVEHWPDTVRAARAWDCREKEEAGERAYADKYYAEAAQRVREAEARKAAMTPEDVKRQSDARDAYRAKLRAGIEEQKAKEEAAYIESQRILAERKAAEIAALKQVAR